MKRLTMEERIENLFSFLYMDEEEWDREFLDQVKAAALRGCAQPEGESNPCVVRWGQSMMVVETLADVDALAEVLRHSLSFKEPSTPQLLTPRDDA
jgi:hypothetical protein